MDKVSIFLILLVGAVGAIIFTVYIQWPISWVLCLFWGLIVVIGAVKIDKYVSINMRSGTE